MGSLGRSFGRAFGRAFVRAGGAGGIGTDPLAPGEPDLTYSAGTNPSEFDMDLPSGSVDPAQDAAVGDIPQIQITAATDTGFASVENDDDGTALDAGDLVADTITLPNGTHTDTSANKIARGRLKRTGHNGPWSATTASFHPPPIMTSATTGNNAEASVLAFALTASETCSFAITGGADSAKFEISGSTLRWASNGVKDYEAPDDVGANNVYNVQVTPTASRDATAGIAQSIAITVTNVEEFSLAYTDHQEHTSSSSTITYTAVGFGAADTNRIVAIGIVSRSTGADTISSMTIGGVSATQVAGARQISADNSFITEIWYAAVPTGTSGNVVINWSANSQRGSITAYRIITATAAPTDDNVATGTAAGGSINASITVPSGGAGFAVYGHRSPGNANAVTWTNATSDYDAIQIGTFVTASSATRSTAGAVTITGAITSAAGAVAHCLSMAAWGP